MARCSHIYADSSQCRRIVSSEQRYCYSHDPARAAERRRNSSLGGRSKGQGELGELKKRIRSLAAAVLDGTVDRGRAAVVGQLFNCEIRALEQQRKQIELQELVGRWAELEALVAAAEEHSAYASRR
jgi:hypothetical protein